jgi:methylaspartate ammonia-lyase
MTSSQNQCHQQLARIGPNATLDKSKKIISELEAQLEKAKDYAKKFSKEINARRSWIREQLVNATLVCPHGGINDEEESTMIWNKWNHHVKMVTGLKTCNVCNESYRPKVTLDESKKTIIDLEAQLAEANDYAKTEIREQLVNATLVCPHGGINDEEESTMIWNKWNHHVKMVTGLKTCNVCNESYRPKVTLDESKKTIIDLEAQLAEANDYAKTESKKIVARRRLLKEQLAKEHTT